jgi:hypothetical protein
MLNPMYDPFGRPFYEWWAGLRRGTRITVACFVLGCGLLGIYLDGNFYVWVTVAAVGALLLVAS